MPILVGSSQFKHTLINIDFVLIYQYCNNKDTPIYLSADLPALAEEIVTVVEEILPVFDSAALQAGNKVLLGPV